MSDLGIETIRDIDKSNMLDLLLNFPSQCEEAYRLGEEFDIPDEYKDFGNIVFTGLGGSAIGADIVKSYLANEIGIPIVINRNYTLPEFVNEESLLFCLSYSGNTEETVSAYNLAKKKKAKILVITSDGDLLKLAEKYKVPYILIPSGLPPRNALGYLFFPNLPIIYKIGLVSEKKSQVKETVELLRNLKDKEIGPDIDVKANVAKQLALSLYDKFPVIYSGIDYFDCVGIRWRGQLSENSKTLASSHLFPELTHNEIVGWKNPHHVLKNFSVIILRDKDDHIRIKRRIDITKSIIKDEAFQIVELWSKGKGLLSRIFSLIYIGDFVSFYLAILNRVDPTPVERIDFLKKELAK